VEEEKEGPAAHGFYIGRKEVGRGKKRSRRSSSKGGKRSSGRFGGHETYNFPQHHHANSMLTIHQSLHPLL